MQVVTKLNNSISFMLIRTIAEVRLYYFEYTLFAAWSEGAVLNNQTDFEEYVLNTKLEYETPVTFFFSELKNK